MLAFVCVDAVYHRLIWLPSHGVTSKEPIVTPPTVASLHRIASLFKKKGGGEPRALQCRLEAGILIHEVRPMIMKLLQALSFTALLVLIKRLVVRKPPSLPYRYPEDEWSKIRGYRRPS